MWLHTDFDTIEYVYALLYKMLVLYFKNNKQNFFTDIRLHFGFRAGGKGSSSGDASSALWGFCRVGIRVCSVFLPGRNSKKKKKNPLPCNRVVSLYGKGHIWGPCLEDRHAGYSGVPWTAWDPGFRLYYIEYSPVENRLYYTPLWKTNTKSFTGWHFSIWTWYLKLKATLTSWSMQMEHATRFPNSRFCIFIC